MFNTLEEIKNRMKSYYPNEVIRIKDIQAIIDALSPWFYECDLGYQRIFDDESLLYMDLERTIEWENLLGIVPLNNSTLQDRRDVVIARLQGVHKLNTESINSIVRTFTGGYAKCWFKDSTVFVEITPPNENKEYKFENVENELKRRIPAHLNFNVARNYYKWGEVLKDNSTWDGVKNNYNCWDEIYIFSPFDENQMK